MKNSHEEKREVDRDLDLRTNQAIGRLISTGGFGKSVLNSINSHIIITDINFDITYINQAAGKVWNVKPEKIIGNNLLESGLYGIPLDLKSNLRKVVEESRSFKVEAVHPDYSPQRRRGRREFLQIVDNYDNLSLLTP